MSRSNAGLVERALTLIEDDQKIFIRGATDPTTGRAGSGAGELMGSLLAAYDLKQGRTTTHPSFAGFESWDDLQKTASEDGGEAYRPYVRLLERHGTGVPRVVALIRDHSCKIEAEADVILSTVHRIKGEEADNVGLAGDFQAFVDAEGHLREEEANIAYVAMTRAKSFLGYGGAFSVIQESLDRRNVKLPVTSIVLAPMRGAATALRPTPHAALPEPRRAYRDAVPGTRWLHPTYGLVTIEDADAQFITVITTEGRKRLGTLMAYDRLQPALD